MNYSHDKTVQMLNDLAGHGNDVEFVAGLNFFKKAVTGTYAEFNEIPENMWNDFHRLGITMCGLLDQEDQKICAFALLIPIGSCSRSMAVKIAEYVGEMVQARIENTFLDLESTEYDNVDSIDDLVNSIEVAEDFDEDFDTAGDSLIFFYEIE